MPDTRNPAAVALSKLGASKGGMARARSLTPRKRRQIAIAAAAARSSHFQQVPMNQPRRFHQ
jgi:hypothetical protein